MSEKVEMHKIKKYIYIFFNKYKMIKITAETFAKTCVHNIMDKEKKLWLRNKNIGKELNVESI